MAGMALAVISWISPFAQITSVRDLGISEKMFLYFLFLIIWIMLPINILEHHIDAASLCGSDRLGLAAGVTVLPTPAK